jgi:hypothetical protein
MGEGEVQLALLPGHRYYSSIVVFACGRAAFVVVIIKDIVEVEVLLGGIIARGIGIL